MSKNCILEARDIHKEYRTSHQTVRVLRGLQLSIGKGEILAILGHSGVGKSTLLNLLGLLDSPTSGQIIYHGKNEKYRGRDLSSMPLADKAAIRNQNLGFVFQFYHLLPDLSVIENIILPAMILQSRSEFNRRRGEIHARAEELLERVGIFDRRDFSPTRLSGGERQRAAIARALINSPEMVYCDEPTGNLDTKTGERIHELILELNRDTDISFVLVTHDNELASLASRQLLMVDGLFQ